jgi:hypothetical protein
MLLTSQRCGGLAVASARIPTVRGVRRNRSRGQGSRVRALVECRRCDRRECGAQDSECEGGSEEHLEIRRKGYSYEILGISRGVSGAEREGKR